MRPVVLTMTAFGPYAGTEVVDFREATDGGLFGIYGATGSGKSSIFNAMTFALFGVGAKPEQSIATMRSGHADADCLTEVSLLFELGDKHYFVRRQPDQSRPKLRGEGETTNAHKAWLFDATSIAVDDVTADNCGVVLAETKVGEVLKLVRELLGYGVEQFRQIVLLPQGRFEKFLIANSNERVEILRELFDVDVYRRIAAQMKEDAAAAKRDFDDGHRLVARRLTDAGFASTDDLATGIAAAAEAAQARHDEATQAEGAAQAAEQAHLSAEVLEGRFKAAEDADRRRLGLERQRDEIEGIQVVLTRAEKAQRVGLPADSEALRRFQRRFRSSVRDYKLRLCEDQSIEVEVQDAPRFEIELAELEATPLIKTFVGEFETAVQSALTGSGRVFSSARDDNVVVFSGGGRSLPFLRSVFKNGIRSGAGMAYFQQDDAKPSWVGRVVPDVTSVFPQIAVATGGCSPDLPTELQTVTDTHDPGARTLSTIYKQ